MHVAAHLINTPSTGRNFLVMLCAFLANHKLNLLSNVNTKVRRARGALRRRQGVLYGCRRCCCCCSGPPPSPPPGLAGPMGLSHPPLSPPPSPQEGAFTPCPTSRMAG